MCPTRCLCFQKNIIKNLKSGSRAIGCRQIENNKKKKIADQSLQNQPIGRDDALFLMRINGDEVYDLFYWANQIRLKYFGHSVKACSIVSAKQGRCTEDCSFCSQSSRYHTGIEEFPLIDTNRILDVAKYAEQAGST